jgi:hypothetical protein
MKVPRRTVLILIGIGALALLSPYLLLFGTPAYDSVREYVHRRPFDSVAWQDSKQVEGDDPVRIRMVDDLVKSRRLDHLSRAEVEKLLGAPTTTDKFRDYDLVYWLGPERGLMRIDSEWLVITFDEKGVLIKYNIVQD